MHGAINEGEAEADAVGKPERVAAAVFVAGGDRDRALEGEAEVDAVGEPERVAAPDFVAAPVLVAGGDCVRALEAVALPVGLAD